MCSMYMGLVAIFYRKYLCIFRPMNCPNEFMILKGEMYVQYIIQQNLTKEQKTIQILIGLNGKHFVTASVCSGTEKTLYI